MDFEFYKGRSFKVRLDLQDEARALHMTTENVNHWKSWI
jgi:hypothetical protein